MRREVLLEDIEELQQPRGHVLGLTQVRRKGQQLATQPARRPTRRVRDAVPTGRRGVAHPQVPGGQGVQDGLVELVEVAAGVDHDDALQGLLGAEVVPQGVVGEVVEDLHGEEEAGGRDALGPVEDAAVDDLDLAGVAAPRRRRLHELRRLERRQRRRDLDDPVLGPVVHRRLHVPDVVQHVEHQRAAARPHLVDDQVVVGVRAHHVVRHQVPRHRLPVVGPEQLRRRVPELPRRVVLLAVERVLELRVPPPQLRVEGRLVGERIEGDGRARAEDYHLFREVPVVRVVEAVYLSGLIMDVLAHALFYLSVCLSLTLLCQMNIKEGVKGKGGRQTLYKVPH